MVSRLLPALLAAGFGTVASAQGFETFNQSNLARFAALPSLGQGAVVPAGESVNSFTLDWTNEFYASGNGRETLIVDGETQRYAMRYRAGLKPRAGYALEWSLAVPILVTNGGAMDSGIEGWHDAFGLPNANRDEFPQDRYRVRYVRDGETLIDLDRGKTGLGDVRLGAGVGLSQRFTLRAMAQLPTGNRNRLTGGHAGGALWLDYSLPLTESRRAALLLSVGAAASATGGPLGDVQSPAVAVGGAVLIVPIYRALDGVLQVNAHSKLYKGSDLDTLSRPGVPLAFGVRLPWQRFVFDFAIVEDASVNASPDFGFILGVKVKQFQAKAEPGS